MADVLFLLRDLIHERTGLFFRDEQGLDTIAHRLAPIAEKNGLDSISAFYRVLKESETTSSEWRETLASLTKQASTFFRQRHHLQVLTGTVLPQMFYGGSRKSLKIWSAGCSTGEEPYAIAIALSEAGWFDRAEVEIYASDASSRAIETARRGVYNNFRLGLPDELLHKNFLPVDDKWQVSPEIQGRILWSVANLFEEDEIVGFANADIIFCRNVFIYFSNSAIIRTLSLFAKFMPVGGCLFTDWGDHFDSLVAQTGLFETQTINGIPIRVRRE